MKKLLLTGYYGFNNYGDDLFVASLNAILKENFKDTSVVSACPSIKGVDSEWTVKQHCLGKYFSSSNIVGLLIRFISIIYPVYRSDLIVHGGGSLFENKGLGIRNVIRKFRKTGSSEVCLGISVSKGALKNAKVSRFLQEMNLILVRDRNSAINLRQAGFPKNKIFCSGDIASYYIFNTSSVKFLKKDVGVSICRCGNYSDDDYRSIIDSIVDFTANNRKRLKVFVLNPSDLELSIDLIAAAKAAKVEAYLIKSSSIGYIEKIQGCELFISMRMHGAVTAFLKYTPFVLIEYGEKCTEFLNDIGYGNIGRVKKIQSLNESLHFLLNSYRAPLINPKDYALAVNKSLNEALNECLS